MNTFKQPAIEILKKAKIPLHYNDITKQALESGILETEGANPERTMNAVITVDINTKGDGSDFIRTDRGVFALNTDKKEIKQTPKIIEAEKEEEEKIVIEGGYIGKGGEPVFNWHEMKYAFNAYYNAMVDAYHDVFTYHPEELNRFRQFLITELE